jgi:4-amino-4-deoxy-L-arabinose transferase-like glycosyltransferase
MIGAPDPGSQRTGEAPARAGKGPLALRIHVTSWQLVLARQISAYPWVRGLGPPAALFLFSLLLRLPFVSNALVNWDAVQFALATRSFDIARHQPHPPGYILYVGWGRLLTWITGDANTAFVLTSLIAGSLAVAVLYLLGREMLGTRSALLAATLFALSPLVWYYSIVALTYAVESLFLLIVAWLCWRALAGGGERQALLASFVLGIAGGVRQSTLVLLIPLWLFATWTSGRRAFWLSWAVLGATCLAWFVPLVWLAGGPLEYLKDGLSLLGFVGGKTSVLAGGLSAVLNNLAQVGGGLLVGLNLGILLVGLAVSRRVSLRSRLARRHGVVLVLWAGPALGVFVLGHIGQIGYLLMILPAAFLVLALYVEAAGCRIAPALGLSAGRATTVLAGLLATAHVATVIMAPSTAHALIRDPIAASMVDVRDNDRFWKEVPVFLDRFTPQEAIVLAEASPWGSFRHAGYYLSGYRVYGLGNDRFGHFGWLFEAYGGLTDYSLEGRARRMMPRPTAARYAIVLDPKIVRTIVQEAPTVEVLATGYRSIWVVDLSGVDALTFEYGRTFLHGPTLETRPDIPWSIRDLRVERGT